MTKPEVIEKGEGGTQFFKFNWEIKETSKGKMSGKVKVRANSLSEAKGALNNSWDEIVEFKQKRQKLEEAK
jgi:hypothetical protein